MAAEVRTEATRRLRTRETKRDQEKQVAYRRRLQTMFASSDTEHQSPQQIRAENGQGRQRHTGGVCTWIVDSSPNNEASVIIRDQIDNHGPQVEQAPAESTEYAPAVA